MNRKLLHNHCRLKTVTLPNPFSTPPPRPSILQYSRLWAHCPISLRRSVAESFTSWDTLGFLVVLNYDTMVSIELMTSSSTNTHALRPPATLFGFLLSEPVPTSPPLNSLSRTSLECCLDSSEVSDNDIRNFSKIDQEYERLTWVVEVGLMATDDVSWVRHDVCQGNALKLI